MIDEGMSTLKTNTQERQAALQNLLSRSDVSTKEADTAFLIELIGSIFGLFGLGHFYAGLTNTGIFRLIAGIAAFALIYFILGVTFIGLCAYPLVWIGQVALGYFSANDLKQAINAVKAGGMGSAAGSSQQTFGGYIESTPASTDDSLFGTPGTSSSNDSLFGSSSAPSSSSDSLFGTPEPVERPYTPSGPEITFDSPPADRTSSGAGTYTTPSDDSDADDFNPDELTKKV